MSSLPLQLSNLNLEVCLMALRQVPQDAPAIPGKAPKLTGQAIVPAAPAKPGFAGFRCEVSDAPIAPQDCLACAQNGAPGCPMTPALVERIVAGIPGARLAWIDRAGHLTALEQPEAVNALLVPFVREHV